MFSSFRTLLLALFVLSGIVIVAKPLGAQSDDATTPSGEEAPVPAPVEVKVMTYNIWVGGDLVDLGGTAQAIRAAEADVVGLQEASGNARRVADLLGWAHVNERLQVISRFPLIDPPGADGDYLLVQVAPGLAFAIANVHLTSDPYGPYAIRDGATVDEVLALEAEVRMPGLEPLLPILGDLAQSPMPVVLTGDFNSPSHLDWTQEAADARTEGMDRVDMPVEWPVTIALEEIGLADSYRAVHPDPVARKGITWSYGYPHGRLAEDERIDRIDMIHVGPNIETLDSRIVGASGDPDVDITVDPYPSDHRAVVSTLRLTPYRPPLLVSPEPRIAEQGEPLVVRYAAPGGPADAIAIVPPEGLPDDAIMWLPPYEAGLYGSVTFGTSTLAPGRYEVILVSTAAALETAREEGRLDLPGEGSDGAATDAAATDATAAGSQEQAAGSTGSDAEAATQAETSAESDDELPVVAARATFWVADPDAVPAVYTAPGYDAGRHIQVQWVDAPGFRFDWIGIYEAGEADLYNAYLAFAYTDAMPEGTVRFGRAELGEEMLPPGRYVARLFLDDAYQLLAEQEFEIK